MELLATMFGKNGPYNAEDLLHIIGVSDEQKLFELISRGRAMLGLTRKARYIDVGLQASPV